ncbi:hypothetical protein [Paraburkholderia sp. PGU19]|uniref:hypothetical protein n=1 Tax=Paraburkholderia sp. PGU19 TaxID=2735434 RepID=UPI0015DBCCAF|nr:hypothetical protein [Paraburkholderia sp. PGU19]
MTEPLDSAASPARQFHFANGTRALLLEPHVDREQFSTVLSVTYRRFNSSRVQVDSMPEWVCAVLRDWRTPTRLRTRQQTETK